MAQADTLVELVKAASSGDQQSFRKAAESLIQEERGKGHRILADRLAKSLQQGPTFQVRSQDKRVGNTISSAHKELIFEISPERSLDSIVLADKVLTQLRELVEEQNRAELLHAHNLQPRHRVLLAGPPGNGKTTVAEALAYELMVPLIVVRYETLIGSYLGETSARLKNLLEYAKTQRCVLFFDEFETLGKERGDTHETGEIKRVVSSLLLQMDDLPDYVVVVAASNHPELLDRAVWRRFQLRIELPLPTRVQLTHFIHSIGIRCQVNFGLTAETIAKHLLGLNFAEVEEFCLSVVRRAVLDQRTDDAKVLTQAKLEQWRNRLKPISQKD
ncbi:AAA family ATPase [Chromobacterium violaceum]|uniref:AAA family ATPase n=1 Tax=Chromobacterium violaceum TaxID=536 RepID=UPI0006538500|nr:ATP-binding protein [Chromobacterium violaceum]KMN87117.1 ATPase AAA [Chromobacterium violaceum]MBX9296436.1 ATP-binding protein [Chromobacterium vaccinii]MBX9357175.1 ATP-binding protein [Chromobacterium vaccinii]